MEQKRNNSIKMFMQTVGPDYINCCLSILLINMERVTVPDSVEQEQKINLGMICICLLKMASLNEHLSNLFMQSSTLILIRKCIIVEGQTMDEN